MTSLKHIRYCLGLLVLTTTASASAQEASDEKELKLNENAIRMIQFEFTPKEKIGMEKPGEAPLQKRWMEFKEKVPFRRSFADTTKVKKISGFVRAIPYTIWKKYGEDPIRDFMPNVEKEWTFYWKLNTADARPAADPQEGVGVRIEVDFDKLLYESLTARGRAIKRNRKHANAWKTYADYVPTIADSLKMPNLWKKTTLLALERKAVAADSVSATGQTTGSPDGTSASGHKRKKRTRHPVDEKEVERVTSIEQYIRQRAAEDSIRRQNFLRKDKEQRNAYDIESQIRRLKERRN